MKKKLVSALSGLALIVSMNTSTGCVTTSRTTNISPQNYALCTDGKYDSDAVCLEDSLEETFKSVYQLKVDVVAVTPAGAESTIASGAGTGLLLKGGYVLTAYHLGHVSSEKLKEEGLPNLDPNAKFLARLYLQAENGREYLLTDVVGNQKLDALISKAPKNMPKLHEYPYAIGNTNDLSVGNITYSMGNASDLGVGVAEGVVSQVTIDPRVKKEFGEKFRTSNPINRGDSGGPIFAVRDGKIELIGVMVAGINETESLNYDVKINDIIKMAGPKAKNIFPKK